MASWQKLYFPKDPARRNQQTKKLTFMILEWNSLSMTREKQKLLSNSVDLFQQQNYYIADKIHSIFYFNLTRNKNFSRKQHRKKVLKRYPPFFTILYQRFMPKKKSLCTSWSQISLCLERMKCNSRMKKKILKTLHTLFSHMVSIDIQFSKKVKKFHNIGP